MPVTVPVIVFAVLAVAAVLVVVVVAVVVLPLLVVVGRVAVDHHLAVLPVHLALQAGRPEAGGLVLGPLLPMVERRVIMNGGDHRRSAGGRRRPRLAVERVAAGLAAAAVGRIGQAGGTTVRT